MKNTFNNSNFKSKPTSYGQVNEKHAKTLYIKRTNCHLHSTGLMVNPLCPILGATPDGIVCKDGESGIIEVKCPYAARDFTIKESIENVKDFCLETDGENISLKKNHKHYFQVQGQLLITGAQFCDFIVFTRNDLFVERIKPNNEVLLTMVKTILKFHAEHFKPYMSSLHYKM